jgi:hypothetical protein
VSRIVDVSAVSAGFTPANPHRALYVSPGVSMETRIEGLTIEASSQPNSAAVVVDADAAPVIASNTLLGGGGGYSTAVYIASGGAPRLYWNVIDGVGSAAPQPSFAVRGIDCVPNLQGNVMRSGEGTNNRAVFLTGCAGVLGGNVVFAERGLGGGARAIELVDTTTQIVSNTIAVDSETAAYHILAQGTVAPNVVTSNNFVRTEATAVAWCYVHNDDVDAGSVRNNNFGCTRIYSGSAVYDTVAQLEAAHPDAADNVVGEPGVVDPASDWHLRDDGTVSCAVARGGLDIGAAAANDIDGVERTEPWSIGAYELDTGCL